MEYEKGINITVNINGEDVTTEGTDNNCSCGYDPNHKHEVKDIIDFPNIFSETQIKQMIDNKISELDLSGNNQAGSTGGTTIVVNNTVKDGVIGIDPDTKIGTDYQKLQAAITEACNLAMTDTPCQINLNRLYNITGAGSLNFTNSYSKTAMPIYIIGHAGGGIIKNDAGIMFTGSVGNVYGVNFNNVYFRGTAGKGMQIFNGRQFLGSSWNNCYFKNVDCIFKTDTYVQTLRMNNCYIIGGTGNLFEFCGLYDAGFYGLVVDNRPGNIFVQNATATSNNYLYNVRVRDCLFEGISTGAVFTLCKVYSAVIDGCYFEQNATNVVFRDGTLIYQFSMSNNYNWTDKSNAFVQWNGTIYNAFSHNNICGGQPLHDTTKLKSVGATGYHGLVSFMDFSTKSQLGTLKPKGITVE